MARYRGPKTKIARKFGEPIFGADKSLEKRNYPPGQHGQAGRRKKKSEYAVQLSEKQKVKYTYGILEKQFSNLFNDSYFQLLLGLINLDICQRIFNSIEGPFVDHILIYSISNLTNHCGLRLKFQVPTAEMLFKELEREKILRTNVPLFTETGFFNYVTIPV